MPQPLTYPGVYVEETGDRPRSIAGVESSTCAFAGRAPRGPLATVAGPVLVSSFTDFENAFGASDPAWPMGEAVRDFFGNGGVRALVLRVRHGAANAGEDSGEAADDAGPALDDADYIGADGSVADGGGGALAALRQADGFGLLCIPPDAPGADTAPAVYRAALALCADCRALLLVDAPAAWDDLRALLGDAEAAIDALGLSGSAARNAALYYPRLQAPAAPGQPARVASGAVAGVIARTDLQRGVWKAPAGLDAKLSPTGTPSAPVDDDANDALNPLAINCLRTFQGRGTVVWGARTLRGRDAMADEYKYVPVRRLALYIERSVQRGIGWAVFEPNDEPLWAQLRLSVGAFMHDLFRQGAFQGTSPRDAYFVRCDAGTVSARDVADGVCNIEIGFAPLKPAEFVVLRIVQATLPPA